MDDSQFGLLESTLKEADKYSLIIIDGLDETFSPSIRYKIIETIESNRKYKHKVLLTTRHYESMDLFDDNRHIFDNYFQIILNGFTREEMLFFMNNELSSKKLFVENLESILQVSDNNPLVCSLIINLIKSDKLTSTDIFKLFNEKLIYRNRKLIDKTSEIIPRYSSNNPVGVKLVSELFGRISADNATAGVLITSSYFSNNAKVYTEKIKSRMSLMDYADLNNWINEINKEV